ncbi:MAG: MFS transporter [Promethearchaeota archaeon]|nr:MAG: MFS transporter [Candidatus Lokiarchaeota archaeon]
MKKLKSNQVLILLTLFSSALFSIITPMAEEISSALSFDENQVAFINSMFLMVGAVSSLMWAVLGDKFSRRVLLIISTLEWSVLTLLTIFSINFFSLLVFQLITAIGFGAALPLIFSLTVDLVESKNRGKRFGTLSAIYVLGNGLGQILSGFLIDYYSWQIPILIISISGFVCTVLLFLIEEPLRGGKDDIYKAIDEATLGVGYKIKFEDLKQIWKIKSTLWILLLNFAMFISIGAISSFFISMLKNDYPWISSTFATGILVIIFGSQIPAGPIFGKLGDKKYKTDKNGRIKVVLICLISGSTLYIIAYSLFFISNELPILILFILFALVGAFLFGGIDPLTQATLGINPPQIRSTIYSLNYLTYTFGRSISLLLLGQFFVVFNNIYSPGYLILSIMALLCTLIILPIIKLLPQDIDNIKSRQI